MNIHEVISELRKLNQPVPIPIRLPDLHEVEQVEKELGVIFHPDYKTYL